MGFFLEIVFVLMITYLYYEYIKPKVKYLFYGYFFFFIGLILQLPFRYVEILLEGVFEVVLISQYFIVPFSIVLSEVVKYFSLKKFIKTRSFKNGFFFGIGWASIESINFFTISFFSIIFSWLSLSFNYTYLLNPNYGLLNFVFLFILNLAINVYVILAITKRNIRYLIAGILFSLVSYFGLLILSGFEEVGFYVFLFSVSLFIIFHHRRKHF